MRGRPTATVEPLDAALSRLQEGSTSYFGVPDVRLHPLRRFSREASIVLQVRVQGAPGIDEIFVKMFKPQGSTAEHREVMRTRVLNDFTSSVRVREQMAGLPGLSAVRPVACFPDDLILVTERVPGETLGVLLEREAVWWPPPVRVARLERILSRTGAWIRAFQERTSLQGEFSLANMREYVDVRLRRLTTMRRAAFTEAWRAGVLRYFDARCAEICPSDLQETPLHADIAPGNVLVAGDDITVIDFAMSTSGGKYHDVARLHSQLDFLRFKPKFRAPVVARLQSALLDGFEPGLSSRHPLFELFLLQHRLCHLANLSGHPGSGLSRAYNWYQRKGHREWLRATAGLADA